MLRRINFWRNRDEKIFRFLVVKFIRKMRLENEGIFPPELSNGKYKWQEVLNYKRELKLPKVNLKELIRQLKI